MSRKTPLNLTPRSAAARQSVGLSSLSRQIYKKVARQGLFTHAPFFHKHFESCSLFLFGDI